MNWYNISKGRSGQLEVTFMPHDQMIVRLWDIIFLETKLTDEILVRPHSFSIGSTETDRTLKGLSKENEANNFMKILWFKPNWM